MSPVILGVIGIAAVLLLMALRMQIGFAMALIGFLPGGLAMATIGACSFFAAISGSSLATAATMGMVALPEMKKFKYSDALATGCLAAGGTLGILIPPSTVLMIYGILTQQSIAELFIAGFIPGIILSLLFILTIYITARVWPEQGPPLPVRGLPSRRGCARSRNRGASSPFFCS